MRVMRKPDIGYTKTKAQISCKVTAQLISAFVFPTRIVQYVFLLNPKFHASSLFLRLYRPVFVGPCQEPEDRFSHIAHITLTLHVCLCLTEYIFITIFQFLGYLANNGWMVMNILTGTCKIVHRLNLYF